MTTVAERSGRASRSRKDESRQQLEGVGDDETDPFSEEELARRPEVRIINKYAVVLAYVRIGLRGVGALALLWATVVLLGGFVSALTKKDFWSLTTIAFVQAAGLSDAVGDDRFAFFGEWFDSLKSNITAQREMHHHEHAQLPTRQRWKRKIHKIVSGTIDLTLILIFFPVASFVIAGPILCVILSAIRVAKQDYGVADGDTSKGNLKPALNLFYYVSLVHGALYTLFMLAEAAGDQVFVEIVSQDGFSPEILDGYLHETKEMCVNNPASTKNWNLITYGAGLLDSQLPEDYARGGRVLTMLMDQDTPVPITQLLIRSPRQRIQKLIGTLGWRNPAEREMRWLAARILEHIACHLNLAQFPGALECVSSLLDTSCHNNADKEALHLPFEIGRSKERKRKHFIEQIQLGDELHERQYGLLMVLSVYLGKWIRKKYCTQNNGDTEQQVSKQRENGEETDEDLVLPGLRILNNLAHIGHNCTLIYNNKVLLSKIVAPVSSDTLIEDIESNAAWTKVVDGSLKVVNRLMGSPGNTGEEMRSEIADDSSSAVKNLVAVLDMDMKNNNCLIELQIQVIEALTQLALYQLANSGLHLIKRALDIFLTNDWMEDYLKDVKKQIDDETKSQHKTQSRPSMGTNLCNIAVWTWEETVNDKNEARAAEAHKKKMVKQAEESASRLKEEAGEALAILLSMGIKSNSETHRSFIVGREGAVHSLTELLDSNNKTIRCVVSTTKTLEIKIKIGCRISAAVILKHLSNYLEEPTLRKVLVELWTTQAHPSDTSTLKWWERSISTCCIAAYKSDEENISDGSQHEPSTLQSHMQKSEERRLQAELLSIIAAVRASKTLDFGSLLLQPQLFTLEDIVVRLKKMVYDNSYATPACLAILKLACEMVKELIPYDGNAQVIQKHNIISTLLRTSKTMARLESSLLFAGVDHDCYGVPVKPLSSVLVKQVKDLLTPKEQELGISEPPSPSGS